ncbi:MAG: universal stress protein [Vicinamibacterales bacterium]
MIKLDRILCPVDLSEFSRHALDHAFALAKWYDAHVTVLHVFSAAEPPLPLIGMPAGLPVLPAVHPDEVAEDVRRFCGPLPTVSRGCPAQIVVAEGDPAKHIVLQAERTDLVVMGTHGRSGFERLFLGSVTDRVLRTTHVPVLTVPQPVERPESVNYRTILCPVDFSDASTRALTYALSLAEETDARLILLHVVEGVPEPPHFGEMGHLNVREYYRYLNEDAMARLKAAVPDEARVWCRPDERVVTGKAYRTILEVAAKDDAEVIVMGVHGTSVLHRRLFGSTTHHVIREAACPVLTLRA